MGRISQGGASRDRGAEDKPYGDRTNPASAGHAGFLDNGRIELRRIAEQAPEITVELRHVAQQLEAEAQAQAQAQDLARRDTE